MTRSLQIRPLRAMAAALACALACAHAAPAFASIAPPRISSSVDAARIVTIGGETAWGRHVDASRSTASTIKLLNALVVRDYASLDQTITVTRRSQAIDVGDVGLRTGQVLTVRQLLKIMLICSANDAAEALAIGIGGNNEANYVALMNLKAKELGLTRTVAADPHGLKAGNTSTARDLTVLARAVMDDRVLRSIVKTRSVKVPHPNGTTTTHNSTNALLGAYAGMEGVKTGFTNAAGYCFIGAARRGDVELVGVVLGAPTLWSRFTEMRKLLDWGFKHIHSRTLVSTATTFPPVPVRGAEVATMEVRASRVATMTLYDGGGALVTTVSLAPTPTAPVAVGSQVGTVTVSRKGRVLASVPLLAATAVPADPLALFRLRPERALP